MDTTLLLFLAYLCLLLWAMRSRTRTLEGPWWFFLRAFFPNWKFYHAVGRPPRLYGRACMASGDWQPWQLVYPRSPRQWFHIFHNPNVNLALTQQNWVDHLAHDINGLADGADLTTFVSYRLVSRLARQALLPDAVAYQFEIRLEATQSAPADFMLQSPVINL